MALQANVFNYMTQDMDVSIHMESNKTLSDIGLCITDVSLPRHENICLH